jgi:hypothetical protein
MTSAVVRRRTASAGPTRSPRMRSSNFKVPARPGHHRSHRPIRFVSSDALRPPARSWSPRQRVCLGKGYKHQTVAIDVTDTILTVYLDGGGTKVVARTNEHPVRWIKAHRPRKVESHV